MATLEQQIMYSVIFTVLFAVLASPYVFKLVNSIMQKINVNVCDQSGLPTNVGLGLHALVFGVLVFLILYFA